MKSFWDAILVIVSAVFILPILSRLYTQARSASAQSNAQLLPYTYPYQSALLQQQYNQQRALQSSQNNYNLITTGIWAASDTLTGIFGDDGSGSN